MPARWSLVAIHFLLNCLWFRYVMLAAGFFLRKKIGIHHSHTCTLVSGCYSFPTQLLASLLSLPFSVKEATEVATFSPSMAAETIPPA